LFCYLQDASRRLTTKFSDGAPALKHAGAPAPVYASGSAARGRALYVSRRSLQRKVRRLRYHVDLLSL
jgi:hypothetical protein